jgi:hypothetical protein
LTTQTLLYIIFAGIAALLLALFQYSYKQKGNSKKNTLFAFLRFLSIFGILLLLINPKFEQIEVYTEKPNLVLAIDNTTSVAHLNQDKNVLNTLEVLQNNKALNDKFNIIPFTIGENLNTLDTLRFNETQTNINKAFRELSQIYKNTISPTVLITDGNQTYGNDYEFSAKKYNQPIYPIILGDTTRFTDLKLQQLNVNKYAYLKNRFPVEAILVYNGSTIVNTSFTVSSGGKTVYSQPISFTEENNSKVVNFTLPANKAGVQGYNATLIPIETEKNKINNSKNFAVEVIDQKTKVAVVSALLHPDLGAIKKSIESNEQREVVFLKPNELISKINDFQLIVLYQPNNSFKQLYEVLNTENKNRIVISGTKTDWNFLNVEAKSYTQDVTSQTENYQAILNPNYSSFIVEDLDFESFPPLASSFGAPSFKVPTEVLLYKKVNSFVTEEPLLATFETNSRREAILLGENIWKWRAQSYVNTQSFNDFDNFIGKLVQYLASNKRKNRLNIDYESFYQGNTNVIVKAQFFNKNYEFDAKENLNITVKDKKTEKTTTVPFILKNNNYEVDLSNLPASEYSFTVKASSEAISKSGQFQILEYNVEQQFLNANVTKLQQLATNSNGQSYFIANYNNITNDLLNNQRYLPIQKSNKNIVPLIDWKYLLFLIILTLAIEWFLRKYNGLI